MSDENVRDCAARLGFELTDSQAQMVEALLRGDTLVLSPRNAGRTYVFEVAKAVANEDEDAYGETEAAPGWFGETLGKKGQGPR